MQEIERLFNYKNYDILIKKKDNKYYVGVRGKVEIWLENAVYDSLNLAITSGREYARIIIDKMIVSRK
jgi:small nuclear ribonucleoprotein (snRNP)-like protein